MTITRRRMLSAALWAPVLARVPVWAAAAAGRVVDVVNAATSRASAAAPQPLARDHMIGPGDEIRTDARSAAQIALDDGSIVTIGAGSIAVFAADAAAFRVDSGSLRFHTDPAAPVESRLATPTLKVALHQAEMIMTVGDKGATTCGVFKGRITCTSIKKGTSVEVAEGQSVRWSDGAFGAGITNLAYVSGDIAVDDGMDAAHAAWGEPPPMSKQRP